MIFDTAKPMGIGPPSAVPHTPGPGSNCSTGHREWKRYSNSVASRRVEVESTSIQPNRTIEKNIIPDGILKKQPHTASDGGLPIVKWIPGESDLRGQIHIWLPHRIA